MNRDVLTAFCKSYVGYEAVKLAAAREKALASLEYLRVLLDLDQTAIDEALADEAEAECGVRTNVSTSAIERVTKQLMLTGRLAPRRGSRSP